jgi:3-oxoacyl-[acyl-carrier protein] reductase
MLRAKSGRIINISSVVGEMGNAGQVPYVSSKAGLTRAQLRLSPRSWRVASVTVNAITPGFIETDMTAALDDKAKREST